MKNKILLLCPLLVLLAALSGCSSQKEPEKVEAKGKSYFAYFDTVSYVYSYAGDSAEQFDYRSAEVSSILNEYHRLFDIYHEYSGMNNLCTVNRSAGGEPVEVDEKLIEFMLTAKELCELTEGEMDVTMGAVLSLWHNCREAALEGSDTAELPTLDELREALTHTGFDKLEIDEDKLTLRLIDADASIDVGALGKGYATERAAQWLYGDKAYGYVLNVGGNIRIIGTKPDGSNWKTGIRDPFNDEELAANIRISDTSCVTSGIYERFFTIDGVRYHHIIDKDTLFPSEFYSSLTVITKDSALADALSTALFCLPYEESCALAQKLEVDALWIFPDGEQRCTPGFEALKAS